MNLKKEVGKQIQKIRKEKNITQEKLAELINIETISLSKIETGKSYPTSENLTKIAQVLEVEPYEFYIFDTTKSINELKQEIHILIEDTDNRKKLADILRFIKVSL